MIHDKNLSMSFWAEATNTTVYIQNRSPHATLENITPKESFSWIRPDLSHLRIFGCLVYIHIPKEKRSKLEPSRKKDIFVGYSETTKGFIVYILGKSSIEIRRDVQFDEEISFKTSLNKEDKEIEIRGSLS